MTETQTKSTLDKQGISGLCSSKNIYLMENHDGAYYIWRDAGVKNKTLIHIDAHHDMWYIKNNSKITIANFICPALKEDIVKEIYWVVPDKTWSFQEPILKHLKKLHRQYSEKNIKINIRHDQISATLLGKSLRVCTLDSLPKFNEKVLLDIDVDYFVIPQISFGKADTHSELPWLWPCEFVTKLIKHNISTDLITIAYSVEGNYTQLKWKYLGYELALRLQNNSNSKESIQVMDLIKDAAISISRSDFQRAENLYLEAKNLMPDLPAILYHLSLLYLENLDKHNEARELYKQAISLDKSYKTAYNNLGPNYYSKKSLMKAKEEYKKILTLHPEDAFAYYGLAQIAYKMKKWNEAECLVRKSLEYDDKLIDSYRLLGDLLSKNGQFTEAIITYEHSLRLALAGYKSLKSSILTCTGAKQPNDPYHFQIYAKLAHLYKIYGNTSEAIKKYKMSIEGGYDNFVIRFSLMQLYLKQKNYLHAIKEIISILKLVKKFFIKTSLK